MVRAVIGANFGDEGKGLITDWLSRTGDHDMVVRYNGGCQAGHTVVTPEGQRHVFQHFGSGTFVGVPTYLSEFFIVNPIMFHHELEVLNALGIKPVIYAHPKCVVTTFADMMINQRIEDKKGDKRHGSVGLGISETIRRSAIPELKITLGDIWDNSNSLTNKLDEICTKYAKFRMEEEIKAPSAMIKAFIKGCSEFANMIHPLGIQECKSPLFEGAQGLLLDQNNKEFFPHLTRSNTGIQNVVSLCKQIGVDKSEIQAYYVTRSYLTRHGAGPLPGEDKSLSYFDNTNLPHKYQGSIRFAPFNYDSYFYRCKDDFGGVDFKKVCTHLDQLELPNSFNIRSFGPTAKDIYGK